MFPRPKQVIDSSSNAHWPIQSISNNDLIFAGGKGISEAAENRNYLAIRMSEEVSEIIRVLQLTTYDEDEWDTDKLTIMKKTQAVIEGSMQNAHDWLQVILASYKIVLIITFVPKFSINKGHGQVTSACC